MLIARNIKAGDGAVVAASARESSEGMARRDGETRGERGMQLVLQGMGGSDRSSLVELRYR